MATNRKDVILPITHLVKIGINLSDYKTFKSIFDEKVYRFYVKGKQVIGDKIIFDVRAMRINEFVDILDEQSLTWIKVD